MSDASNKFQQYENELKSQIDDWNDRIKQLESQLEQETGDKAEKLSSQLDEVQGLKRKFETRLEELQDFTNKEWENLKLGVERARYEVNLALDELQKKK